MKILVIHGEDIDKSRQRLNYLVAQYKNKNWQINKGSNINQITTGSLFDEKRLYVIENIADFNLNLIKTNLDTNIIFWYDGNLNASLIKKLPHETKFEKFDIPKYIFKFLDAFYPGNSKSSLFLFHQIVEKDPPEFVVAMLTRTLKDLYLVKLDAKSLGYPSWRLTKLKNQADKFSLEKIKEIINLLAEADIKSKTSDTNLLDSLDLIIIKELK